MRPQRITLTVLCAHCGADIETTRKRLDRGQGRFCSRQCCNAFRTATRTFDRARWLANAKARNRAFVNEVNARTVCAHCGVQPIEWHNTEHVELNREGFRISTMVTAGSTVAAIQAEMNRCTPLCHRCHMIEDGRMEASIRRALNMKLPPRPCVQCGRLDNPLRRGLCGRCYQQQPDRVAQCRDYECRRPKRRAR